MKTPLFLAALALVVVMVAIPSHACARGVTPISNDYPNCPQYEMVVGEHGTSLSMDSYGRLLLDVVALDIPDLDYFVIDEPSLYGAGSYLFAMWMYRETNGVPSLQRYDELCQSGQWWETDEMVFIC